MMKEDVAEGISKEVKEIDQRLKEISNKDEKKCKCSCSDVFDCICEFVEGNLPMTLTHNNDMLDDEAFANCFKKCSCHPKKFCSYVCSLFILMPAMWTFFSFIQRVGEVSD